LFSLFFNNNAIGQTLESINEKIHVTNPQIEVGLEPNEVKVDKFLNKVYVANERSNSISVLDSNLGTLKEIFVNTLPHDVEVNDKIHHVYISGKSPSETISIIDGRTDELLQNIPLKEEPLDIEVNEKDHSVYVLAEHGLYSLNEKTNRLTNISVSEPFSNIEVNENSNIIYLTSESSDSLFAIHGPKHKVAVGITFNIFPLNSGRILCGDGDEKTEYPVNQYLYEEPGIICIAKANSGYEFGGWSENIDSNTTRPLKSL
jgi:YVTN family beta-propeller protein